jgi:hypothetical protein
MSEASREADRLDRALDRLLNGQPVPVFDEVELEELVQLAGRLHRSLPRDLPDPAFRDGLLEQLLEPRPRPLPMQPRQSRLRQNPAYVFGGAIAAVFVAVLAVGVLASGQFWTNSPDTDPLPLGAGLTDEVQPTIQAMATATATFGSIAVVSTREPLQVEETPPSMAAVPPLMPSQIEVGAKATLAVADPPPGSNITYELASTLPEPEPVAPVYRFAVPDVDVMSLFNEVSNALNLDGELTTRSVRGKTVISFESTNGTTFTWLPASGAFACELLGEAARFTGEPEEIVSQAYSWLKNSGFPLQDPAPEPIITHGDDGSLQVDFPVDGFTNLALGHPLTVSVLIDREGVIRSVSGYWLHLVETMHFDMLTPEEAWQDLREGKGFWSSMVPIVEPGEYQVRSFSLSYVLTINANQDLVLQPVYRALGAFVDHQGNVIDNVSVLIQAVDREHP